MNKASTAPPGWELRTVGSLGSVRGGKRLPKGRYLTELPTRHPYIRVTDMRPGWVDTSNLRYVPDDVAPSIRAYRIFNDDIFISVAGTLGIVGRIPDELDGANLTENADRITSIDCDVDYLMYALLSEPIQREIEAIRTVGAQPKLALGRIGQFQTLIPKSRSEQSRVAWALRDVDQHIAALERMIAKKEAVKQGMLQQLLTGRTRLPGFTEPWSATTLGTLGTWLKGRGVKRDDLQTSGIRCIRYGELYTTFHDYTSETKSFVSPDVAATALPLMTRDLLFAGSGETREEIGKCVAYVGPAPAVAGGDVIVLRSDRCNPIYLALLANTAEVASQKARAGQGDAVVHIYSHALAAVEVILPPRDEQDAVAAVIVDADREIGVLQQLLRKARAIKQGITQELLTGRTRLLLGEGVS